MRGYLLFFIILFFTGLANAQGPTITSASEAIPGDVFVYPNVAVAGVALPAAGANVTWDYSGIVDSGDVEIDSFKAPAATPYSGIFPGTNLVLASSGAYLYFATNTSNWVALGYINPGNDTTYYVSTLNEFHFLFSYGSTYTDSTKTIGHFSGGRDTFEIITVENGTGYGTLKIPGQTIANVLQVRKINTTRFTFGTFTSTSTDTSFIFVTPAKRSFLMEIDLGSQHDISNMKYVYNGVIVTPTTYTFNGNGNWTVSSNWLNGAVPTSPVPSGTVVTITPQIGGSCILNTPVTFSAGSTLTVSPTAAFKVLGNLTISK